MRFMVILPASTKSEAGIPPSDKEIFAAMGFNEELVKAGVMLAAEGLHPSSKGARLRYADGKVTVTDGPFTESKELIAGFWLLDVRSKEEAIEWMKRAPFGGGLQLEVRQVIEMTDLAPDLAAELLPREKQMQDQVAERRK
jgi:hypothetical protein